MVEPLRGEGRRQDGVVGDLVDHLLRRPLAPAVNGVAVPPFQRRADDLGKRAGHGDLEDHLPALLQRGDPCVDGLRFIREPVLEIARLRLVGAGQGHRRGVADMQIVIDGADRGHLDRRVRQPVQYVALAIFRGDMIEVMDARIPEKPSMVKLWVRPPIV
jgi:hypothetical protein